MVTVRRGRWVRWLALSVAAAALRLGAQDLAIRAEAMLEDDR